MNKEHKPADLDLISKYLSGEASPEEAMQLHDSLKEQDKKDEFNKITRLWNHLTVSANEQVPSAQNEWTELGRKIKYPGKFTIRTLVFNRYAATACVIGLIVIILHTWSNDGKMEQAATFNEQLHIVNTAANEVSKHTLPDGSIVIMNKNSSATYSLAFNSATREVTITGEAYFNVVPNKRKPFIIAVDNLRIKVVGTTFNVRNNFPDSSIELQVQSGIVKMYTAKKEITVIKGQTGTYYKADGELTLKDSLDVNSLSYATKSFYFNDLPLPDACRYLEKAFNSTINIDSAKFSNCRLSAAFNNKSLDYILDIISATLNCQYKKDGNKIYITGQGCLKKEI